MHQDLIEKIDAAVLLFQGNPRQVVAANTKALQLFEKELHQVQGHRGGEVFDCIHSFTDAGCGKDANCEHCPVKSAIVDTLTNATPHHAVSATLRVIKPGGVASRSIQISTEKMGELALVTIERYEDA